MKHQTKFSCTALALLALVTSSNAQDVHHDGIRNSPLGNATLSEDAAGQLVVSNIGSSGLDGVRIQLDNTQGAKCEPIMLLGTNGRCILQSEVQQQGAPSSVPVGIVVTADGSGTGAFYEPDYTALGQQTYTLRLSNNGQLVYDQSGLTGPTKMQSGGGLAALPQKVYMFTMPFGPWGGAYLTCFPNGGGTIVTPPGAGQIAADFCEFISDPAQIIEVSSVALLASGMTEFSLDLEEMRVFGMWATGLDDAHIEKQPNGSLKVDNLGSSGCDGVSIAPGGGTGEVQVELAELAAPGHNGGIVKLQSSTASGEVDELTASESQGLWEFTPDFSQLGSQTYTLELFDGGQSVFQQGGMSGPAVSMAAFARFYKKTTVYPNGTTTTEWCIGGNSSTAHTVSGGPTVQADMFTVRSESFIVADDELQRVMLRAGNLGGDLFINSITAPDPCVGTSYCISAPNSVGSGALLCSSGSSSIAANDLVLTCTGLPGNKFGLFFYGPNQIQTPFGNGWRCVGGQVHRLPAQLSSAGGLVTNAIDNTNPPTAAGQLFAGQDWNFQFWYRDPAAGGAGFNLSDGHAILFTP